MCGRFTQNYTWAELHALMNLLGDARNLRPRYNIAPTTDVDVIRRNHDGERELSSMRWGLVPFFWKKPLKELPATFNARAETVAEKPSFRDAFKRRRCIIPARMTPYHDRMPILLAAEDHEAWLRGTLGADALKPAAESALREWTVSKRMNRPGSTDDDPTTIEAAA